MNEPELKRVPVLKPAERWAYPLLALVVLVSVGWNIVQQIDYRGESPPWVTTSISVRHVHGDTYVMRFSGYRTNCGCEIRGAQTQAKLASGAHVPVREIDGHVDGAPDLCGVNAAGDPLTIERRFSYAGDVEAEPVYARSVGGYGCFTERLGREYPDHAATPWVRLPPRKEGHHNAPTRESE